jgi:hypothetical protein
VLLGLTTGACSPDPDPGADTGSFVDEDDATAGDAVEETDRQPDTLEIPDGEITEPPPDTDAGAPDTDATPDRPDTDAGEVDTGPDCTIDSDSDGLTDCEERNYGECLDPHEGDSDGDSLGDLEELQRGSDPCETDSDNDGASDKTEFERGLDPSRPDTYGDGVKDGNRWILSACDDPKSESVIFKTNRTGNWKIALPTAFRNAYTDLTIPSPPSTVSASAVYDDTTNEVSGFLLSREAPAGQTSPSDPLGGRVDSKVRSLSSKVLYDILGSEFTTHGDKSAASIDYEIRTGQKISVRNLREQLLLDLSGFQKSTLQGLPSTAGKTYDEFRLQITVTERNHGANLTSNLYSVAVAPLSMYETVDKVTFRIDDLTNTTNVADVAYNHKTDCTRMKPDKDLPATEFYWVLDQSGSMDSYNNTIINLSTQFEKRVRNTRIDYRFGVTNMDPANDGRLVSPPAWHQNSQTFAQEIRDRVTACSETGGWKCSGFEEHGLSAAYRGLNYMLGLNAQTPTPAERTRSGANTLTIFMTDAGTQGNNVADAKRFYKNNDNALAFAITPPAQNPGCSTEGMKGDYREVALNSGGGAYSNLCTVDLKKTITTIIRQAAFLGDDFELDATPISSSLRVYLVNDDRKTASWVPRNRDNGFDYSSSENSLAFFGKFRPEFKQTGPPDWIAVTFEKFHNGCKDRDLPPGADTCALPSP